MTTALATARSSPLGLYLDEIRSLQSLSREEEADLAVRVADGDAVAREALIVSGLKIVVCIAKGYHRLGFSFDDLLSEGTLGLIRGVESYDPNVGCRLSRYVGFWIRQAIRLAINRSMYSIRLPARAQSLLTRWQTTESRLANTLGRAPTDDEVCTAGEFTPADLRRVHRMTRVRAIGQSAASASSLGILDFVADTSADAPGDRQETSEQLESLVELLDTLPEPERGVLRSRFGFGGDAPASLRQVAEQVGCSHEAVRHLERAALNHLRSRLNDSVSLAR